MVLDSDIIDFKMAMSSRGLAVSAMIVILLALTMYALSIWILVYMFKLEKTNCKCALGWKHRFIQVMLFVILLNPFLVLLGRKAKIENVVRSITGILSLVYIVITFMYVKELEDSKCGCSEDSARTTMKVINYINIAVLSMFILAMIVGSVILVKAVGSSNDPLLSINKSPALAPSMNIAQSMPSKGRKSKRHSFAFYI